MPDNPHGQSLRFRVKIDGEGDLGNWSKCDGLAVEYDVFEYKEGGENAFIHRIPGRAKYQNIKLTRPINRDTTKGSNWIAKIKIEGTRQTAEIAALDPERKPIATWNRVGAFPGKRTGPTTAYGGTQVAN